MKGSHSGDLLGANMLRGRRMGIDTLHEAVVFMRKECPVCRSEGFDANARVRLSRADRRGDRKVEVSVPELERWSNHTPVLVDDIVSTARTMIATLTHLAAAGARTAVGLPNCRHWVREVWQRPRRGMS